MNDTTTQPIDDTLTLTPKQQRIVEGNMGLVCRYVQVRIERQPSLAVYEDDMTSEAYLGLCKAVLIHDPERGKLSTIAWHCMQSRVDLWVDQQFRHRRNCEQAKYHLPVSYTESHDLDDPMVGVQRHLAKLRAADRELIENKIKGVRARQEAERLGVTKQRVSQLRIKAIQHLREVMLCQESA